jgi:hypothetical protein
MTTVRPFGLGDAVLFLLVLAAAAGVRAGYLAFGCDSARQGGPILVQGEAPELRALVTSVKERGLFASQAPFAATEEPTAHTAPGYPWLVGLLARLPVDLDPTVRWIQSGLGSLTAGLYFLFARRAFRSLLVGFLAGLAAAVYPFWVFNTAELSDGVLATFLLAACLFLGARAGQSGGSLASLLYGLALAGLSLTRAALLPFAIVALLWFLLRARTLPRGWLLALLAFLGFANGLTPWALRNYQLLHDVVPVADSAYLHLWIGNNPAATGGPENEQALLEGLAQRRGQSAEETAHQLAELPQDRRYATLAGAVVDEARANPLGTVQRRIWAGLYFVFGEEWFRNRQLWRTVEGPTLVAGDAEAKPEPAAEPPVAAWARGAAPLLLTGTLLAVLLLSVLGWRWTYAWRRESMPAALAVIWVPLPYLLSHADALNGPRLPLDGVLLCFAAFTLTCLLPGVGGRLRNGARD